MSRFITMSQVEGKPGKVYYPLVLKSTPLPTPSAYQVTVAISAAALNHRDLFLRQHLYPAPSFDVPLLADGCGIVIAVGSAASKSWLGKRVILTPGRGWKDDLEGPESPDGYAILGGTSKYALGTLQEVVCIDQNEIEEAPSHLTDVEAAALPLTGLTGWRALVTKSGHAIPGRNLLITGIGGGVALNILQFAVAKGMNVWVTSGDSQKIEKAKQLGAKGGVNYKDNGWEKILKKQLPNDHPHFDTVIDGAGGSLIAKATKLLKPGGVVVQYGMTMSPNMQWSMPAVLNNLELRGTTMGSRREFHDMVAFVNEKKIKPVVSRVVKGIENLEGIDGLFEDMKSGSQFGKLVIEFCASPSSKL